MMRELTVVAWWCLVCAVAAGDAPVITSLHGNGLLTWTNGVNTNAVYRIEWAAEAGGPWYRTMQSIASVDAHSSTSFAVRVPMLYRVAMVTNETPRGMVLVEDGAFTMGDSNNAGNSDERPTHDVTVSAFWISEMEVTKVLWDTVKSWAITNGYTFSSDSGQAKTTNAPVCRLNWYDAVKWCNARSQLDRFRPCYYTDSSLASVYTQQEINIQNTWVDWGADGYRLPTEAEWERAARGGRQGLMFPWGAGTIQHARANYYSSTESYDTSSTKGYHPVYFEGVIPYAGATGSFPANGFGVHDMAGNVQEWCWDWYGIDYYDGSPSTDPTGPDTGSGRVLRGGGWLNSAFFLRCSCRVYLGPNDKTSNIGFRCVRRVE